MCLILEVERIVGCCAKCVRFRKFVPLSFPVATAMPEPRSNSMRCCGHTEVDRGTEPLGGHGRQQKDSSAELPFIRIDVVIYLVLNDVVLIALGTKCVLFQMFVPVSFPVATAMPEPRSNTMMVRPDRSSRPWHGATWWTWKAAATHVIVRDQSRCCVFAAWASSTAI